MRVLGVIPARGGSKRVKRKNLRDLCGKPLIQYTIEAAARSEKLTTFVVSTEDYEIGQVASNLGAYVVRRPEELAQDDTTTGAVLAHACKWMEPDPFDFVVCLHPTSPIRDPKDIDRAISGLASGPEWYNSLASVCMLPRKTHKNILADGKWFGQDGTCAILNGSIYALRRDWLMQHQKHVDTEGVMIPYPMDRRHSLDIDEEIDLKIAELFLQERE